MDTTTPSQITEALRDFANKLQAKEPVFVDVRPEFWADKGNCFLNSKRYCGEHQGATVVNGFIIRSNGVWADAEYHALVRLPNGDLIDPTQEGKDHLLFAEIEGERSQATGVKAIALKGHSCVQYFVTLYNKGHALMESLAIFEKDGARRYLQTDELQDLKRDSYIAMLAVEKAFKNKWPAF